MQVLKNVKYIFPLHIAYLYLKISSFYRHHCYVFTILLPTNNYSEVQVILVIVVMYEHTVSTALSLEFHVNVDHACKGPRADK